MKTLISLLPLFISSAEAAAAGGKNGHITDLALPLMNVGLLLFLIIFFTRKTIRANFQQNSKDVESLYKHAEEKEKEAQIRYAQYEQKMQNLDSETKKTLDQADQDAQKMENQIQQETQIQMKKLEEDAVKKAEYEKNVLVQELNESLLDEVITRAKNKIKSDKNLQQQATTRLSSEVQ
jgi:F0F1-type ATP synthase membrane subunit b/b'